MFNIYLITTLLMISSLGSVIWLLNFVVIVGALNWNICYVCKNSTVIDYFILSSNVFPLVNEFEVMNFDPMLSDVHSPIHISFCVKETENVNFSNDVSTSSNVNKNFIKWKSERKEDYVDLVSTNISNVINVLDTIKPDNVL